MQWNVYNEWKTIDILQIIVEQTTAMLIITINGIVGSCMYVKKCISYLIQLKGWAVLRHPEWSATTFQDRSWGIKSM